MGPRQSRPRQAIIGLDDPWNIPDTPHPEQRLSDLLLGSYAIDAVVPGMIDPLTPGTNRPLRDVIVESSNSWPSERASSLRPRSIPSRTSPGRL